MSAPTDPKAPFPSASPAQPDPGSHSGLPASQDDGVVAFDGEGFPAGFGALEPPSPADVVAGGTAYPPAAAAPEGGALELPPTFLPADQSAGSAPAAAAGEDGTLPSFMTSAPDAAARLPHDDALALVARAQVLRDDLKACHDQLQVTLEHVRTAAGQAGWERLQLQTLVQALEKLELPTWPPADIPLAELTKVARGQADAVLTYGDAQHTQAALARAQDGLETVRRHLRRHEGELEVVLPNVGKRTIQLRHLPAEANQRVSKQKRSVKRVPWHARVELFHRTGFRLAFTVNLSEGGLFAAMVEAPPVGEAVEVNLLLPRGQVVQGKARVRWARAHHPDQEEWAEGIGLAFESFLGGSEKTLASFVQARRAEANAGLA